VGRAGRVAVPAGGGGLAVDERLPDRTVPRRDDGELAAVRTGRGRLEDVLRPVEPVDGRAGYLEDVQRGFDDQPGDVLRGLGFEEGARGVVEGCERALELASLGDVTDDADVPMFLAQRVRREPRLDRKPVAVGRPEVGRERGELAVAGRQDSRVCARNRLDRTD